MVFGLLDAIIPDSLISGGNDVNIKDSTKITKNFENNQKINRSMTVNSLTKIFNDVANDVIQKNTSTASAAVGASNTIFMSGINCETVVISGIKQTSDASSTVNVQSSQQNISKISNDITNEISKTIEKVGQTDLADLEAQNTRKLNQFMSAVPGYNPNKALELASKCPDKKKSVISVGNDCEISSEYQLDASVKSVLDLDESFTINDDDDVNNTIKNKIEQTNFASCQSSATAENAIVIQDIMCQVRSAADSAAREARRGGTFIFEDVEQQATARLYMTCIFNQQNVNEIANKIYNNIAKKYNQIYNEVARKANTMGPDGNKYYLKATELVDYLAAAGMERIDAAAGNLPKSTNTTLQNNTAPTAPTAPTSPTSPTSPTAPTAPTAPTSPTSPTSPIAPTAPTGPISPTGPKTLTETKDETIETQSEQKSESFNLLWLIVPVSIFILIGIIIAIVKKRQNN